MKIITPSQNVKNTSPANKNATTSDISHDAHGLSFIPLKLLNNCCPNSKENKNISATTANLTKLKIQVIELYNNPPLHCFDFQKPPTILLRANSSQDLQLGIPDVIVVIPAHFALPSAYSHFVSHFVASNIPFVLHISKLL